MLDRPLARLLPRLSEAARDALDALGVRFLGSCSIDSASVDARGAVIHTSTHGDIRCDVLISAAGFRSSLPPELAGPDARTLTLAADEQLRVLGHEGLWACGDCVSFPHPRWGRIAIPHWDHALWSGRHVADSILGSPEPYVREPYFFSDIGSLRIQQVGVADAAAASGHEDGGLAVGLDVQARPRASFSSTPRRGCARLVSSSRARPVHSPPSTPRRHIMSVRLIVDPDACIGSAECVALDPEAVELDEHGTARVLVPELDEERADEHLRRLPGRGAHDRRAGAERVVRPNRPEHDRVELPSAAQRAQRVQDHRDIHAFLEDGSRDRRQVSEAGDDHRAQ